MIDVTIQKNIFDPGIAINKLYEENYSVGGVSTFIGYMRNINEDKHIKSMFLEYYPIMTEKSINNIVFQAQKNWNVSQSGW